MRDVRLAALIRAVESRFPGTSVVVRPARSPDDPAIPWFVRILHVRDEDHLVVDTYARRLADELYGKEPVPFYLTTEDARTSAAFLKIDRAERALRERRARSRARSRGRSRPRRRPRVKPGRTRRASRRER